MPGSRHLAVGWHTQVDTAQPGGATAAQDKESWGVGGSHLLGFPGASCSLSSIRSQERVWRPVTAGDKGLKFIEFQLHASHLPGI